MGGTMIVIEEREKGGGGIFERKVFLDLENVWGKKVDDDVVVSNDENMFAKSTHSNKNV